MKTLELSCREVGVDCDFVCKGKDEKEILDRAKRHGAQAHGLKELSPDLIEKARKFIHVVETKGAY